VPIIRRKLLYLFDTGVFNSVWVASGLLVGLKSNQYTRLHPYGVKTPVAHRYSNFLMMGTWILETCREVK